MPASRIWLGSGNHDVTYFPGLFAGLPASRTPSRLPKLERIGLCQLIIHIEVEL